MAVLIALLLLVIGFTALTTYARHDRFAGPATATSTSTTSAPSPTATSFACTDPRVHGHGEGRPPRTVGALRVSRLDRGQLPPVSFSRSACSASSEASEPADSSVVAAEDEYEVASLASASACLASACCLTWASQRA